MRIYQNTLPEVVCSHEELVEKSIQTIKHWEHLALKYDLEDGYWLAFSGGKDSVVIKELAIRAGVKFKAHYNMTTIDPPELCAFIRRNHPDVIWEKQREPFWKRLETKGPPTRLIRWCCDEYKEGRGRDKDKVTILGIRALESARRMANWQMIMNHKKFGWCLNPILYWRDMDVWKFIKENNIPYCSLYDEGFKRLGCVGCPMHGRGRFSDFRRWPKFEKLWRKGVNRYWERTHNILNRQGESYYSSRFKSGDEYFSWWLSDNPSPKEDDCQMGLW